MNERSRRGLPRWTAMLCASLLGGCMLLDVREQEKEMDAACIIEGSVASAHGHTGAIVVVLAERMTGEAAKGGTWRIADHFVLERPGHWMFAAAATHYGLAAFEDTNGDFAYQPGEPLLGIDPAKTIACKRGARFKDIALTISTDAGPAAAADLGIPALHTRTLESQLHVTLGQLTAVGDIASLSDARFSEANAESGLWRPFDFIFSARPGVYFLEPYEARKTPVLFVHGINGTPAQFRYLIERMDRERFQPWVYYYPSGAALGEIADHLTQTMTKLHVRHGYRRIVVVAHSMGGLVARGFILRQVQLSGSGRVPLFISISTPWEGHKAAELGVKYSPAVVRVWVDMAPGSAYLRSLYAHPLPAELRHHLVFTFNRNSASFGESGDHTVTVASQLGSQAQRESVRLHGFDDTHVGVLRNAQASALLNLLLVRE